MTIRLKGARRSAFFGALGATGNITLAAERAKLDREWVRRRRKSDAAFDAACRAAIAAAGETLRMRDGFAPPSGWGHLDGAELAVRGAPGRRVQIRRARLHGWSPSVERRFLATLGATCNVKAACAEVGLTQASAYYHRRQWPAFAGRWDTAIEQGYVRLEAGLIEAACNLFSDPEFPPEAPIAPMSAEQAIHLLHMHKNQVRGIGKPMGAWRRPRTLDEVRASIVRKFEAFEWAGEISEADKARDAREWALRRGSGQALRRGSGQARRRGEASFGDPDER